MTVVIDNIVQWCLDRQKEGKIFEKWTAADLRDCIVKKIRANEFVLLIDADKREIIGATIYHLDHVNKEVFIDNIVSTRPKCIWRMFIKILSSHEEVDFKGWNFTGTHRSGRKRKFIVTSKLFKRFAKI